MLLYPTLYLGLVCFFFEQLTSMLDIQFFSDYAFYSALILGGLGYFSSFTRYSLIDIDPSNHAAVAAKSLSGKPRTKNTVNSINLGACFYLASLFSFLLSALLAI